MVRKKLLNLFVLAAAATVAMGLNQGCTSQHAPQQTSGPNPSESPVASPRNADIAHVPAYYETAPSAAELKPVLAAGQFSGKTREAYEVVKKIPATIAQMPCYCHCDRGMGHKSLHSCFEDDHAAHCAMCVDEALMTFELQKQGLSPIQIREQIIAKFGG